MKSKFYYPYLKFGLWASLAFFLLTLLTAITLRLTVKQSDIESWVRRVALEQTGGRLEFKVEHFDILNHISIRDIAFTGPKTEVGLSEGGELSSAPIIRLDHIEIIPRLTSIWRGAAKVKLFHLDKPHVTINLTNSQDNLSGLLKYRAKKFPPREKATPWYELPKIPIFLDQIFIPGVISLENFQVSDLEVKFFSDHLKISFGPISIQASASASGKKMQFVASVLSIPANLGLTFDGKAYNWKLALENRLQLFSWTDFELAGKNTVKGSLIKQPLKNEYLVKGNFARDLSGFNLKDIALEVANTLKVTGHAEIEAKNHELLKFDASASLKGFLNLDNPLTQILTDMFGIKTEGKADFLVTVNGESQIDEKFIPKKLAPTNLTFNFRDVNIAFSNMIELKDLQLASSLVVESKDEDIILHPKTSMSFDKFKLNFIDLSIYLNQLSLKLQSHTSVKKLKLDDFQLSSDIESVGLDFQKKTIAREPFHFGFKAKSNEKLGNLQSAGEGSLGKLIKIGLSASCVDPCTRPVFKAWTRAESLTPLMELVRSRVPLQLKKFIPSYFEGLAGAETQILFDTPDIGEGVSLKKLNLDWNVNANISNLDVKIPFYSTSGENFNLEISGSGKDDHGSIKTKASLGLVQLSPSPTMNIALRKNTFTSETQVIISDLVKLPQSLQSVSEWSVGNDHLELNSGQIFNENLASGMIKTEGISKVLAEIKKSTLIGGGLSTHLSLKADLEAQIIDTSFAFSFNPAFLSRYIKGLKSEGSAAVTGGLSVKNWEDISLTAEAKFDRLTSEYDASIANVSGAKDLESGKNSKPGNFLFKIGMIEGAVPIVINEKISTMKRWFEKPKPLVLKERIRSYLENDARLTQISLPENTLVAWKDSTLTEKKYLKIRDFLLNGVGLNELDLAVEVSSKSILVKNYTASFLKGKLQGSAFLPLSPFPERLMLASHVLGIDSALVPQLMGKNLGQKKSEPISGNFHLDYFIRSSLIDAVFDLTSIGADQMLYLLELIDPDHADPAMNNVRRALKLGTLKKAMAKIKHGELALDLDVRIAAIPVPIPSLGGIKVSNVIDNLKAELFAKKVSE